MHPTLFQLILCVSFWAHLLTAVDVWMVFPVESEQTPDVETQIEQEIVDILESSKKQEVIRSTALQRVVFWRIYADNVQADAIRRIRFIAAVVKREPMTANSQEMGSFKSRNLGNKTIDTNLGVVRERQAPLDLKLLSWPFNKKLPQWGFLKRLVSYNYENGIPGRGEIYIIDSGVYIEHGDFDQQRVGDWLIVNGGRDEYKDDDPGGHGTCVTSKAVGQRFGVSRSATYHPVKAGLTSDALIEAFQAVLDHIDDKKKRNVVIVSTLSAGPYPPKSYENPPEQWKRLDNLFAILLETYGASIVVAAGNYRKTRSPTIDTYPALLGSRTPYNIFVVAETDLNGFRSPRSQAFSERGHTTPPPTYWAPTHGAICADLKDPEASAKVGGTSFAAAMFAGLISYFWSLQTPPWRIRDNGRDQVTEIWHTMVFQARRTLTGKDLGPEQIIWNLQGEGALSFDGIGPDGNTSAGDVQLDNVSWLPALNLSSPRPATQ